MYTLNFKGKLLVIEKPLVMGIINATPDSFYEGHLHKGEEAVMALADTMVNEGADILDIGGQSTRPGSSRISAEDEIHRVLPIIQMLRKKYPEIILSIDTYHAAVAATAVSNGANMVNDIGAGNMDTEMLATVASLQVPYICMHMKGVPENMQQHANYDDVTKEVLDFFIKKIAECKATGIKDVIVDPGFGFGKTTEHNFTLLKNMNVFKMLRNPIMAGLSRKGSVYKTLKITAGEALNGTTVLNTIALLNGASIIRVHDVREAKEAIQLIKIYKNA